MFLFLDEGTDLGMSLSYFFKFNHVIFSDRFELMLVVGGNAFKGLNGS